VAALAVAGIVAPIVFTLLVILQGLLQPEYSHLVLPISALAVLPLGWIQNLNFYLTGALMAAYAVGLHAGIRRRRRSVVGPALLMISGIGLIVAGTFPMITDPSGALVEPPGHVVGAILSFLGAGLALTALSRRMAADPRWRNLATYVFASGIAIVVLFVMMAGLAVPSDGMLHSWFGLLQRVVLAIWFPCLIVLAVRLLRITRGASHLDDGGGC
jgi:hypothetical membrane protein